MIPTFDPAGCAGAERRGEGADAESGVAERGRRRKEAAGPHSRGHPKGAAPLLQKGRPMRLSCAACLPTSSALLRPVMIAGGQCRALLLARVKVYA